MVAFAHASSFRRSVNVAFVVGLVLASTAALAACGDDAPSSATTTASVDDVTSVTLIRAEGQEVVRAQVLNPSDTAATYTVAVAIASSDGTKIGSTTVTVTDVPAGAKKSATSDPLSPTVPLTSQLIVTDVTRSGS